MDLLSAAKSTRSSLDSDPSSSVFLDDSAAGVTAGEADVLSIGAEESNDTAVGDVGCRGAAALNEGPGSLAVCTLPTSTVECYNYYSVCDDDFQAMT